jgi:hypothetical protein
MNQVRQDPAYSFAWTEVPAGHLEEVFSPGHRYHNRIVYDAKEGSYYDKHTDLYLTLEEAKGYGVPA